MLCANAYENQHTHDNNINCQSAAISYKNIRIMCIMPATIWCRSFSRFLSNAYAFSYQYKGKDSENEQAQSHASPYNIYKPLEIYEQC